MLLLGVRERFARDMVAFSPQGALTALVTPFADSADAPVDFPALERLVERQIAARISALVPLGTTGESPTLSVTERHAVATRVVTVADGRVPVLVGIGTASTRTSVEQAKAALDAGADALMLSMPAYSRPSQAGLLHHISEVAASTELPLVLYNVPARTAVSLELATLETACQRHDSIVGLKDASGHVHYCQAVQRRLGGRLAVLCGDDALTLPMLSVGARGVISVTANLLPAEVQAVVRSAQTGDFERARSQHLALLELHETLFTDASPAPIKAAMAAHGLIADVLRPPLLPTNPECRKRLAQALSAYENA